MRRKLIFRGCYNGLPRERRSRSREREFRSPDWWRWRRRACGRWDSHEGRYGSRTILMPPCRTICWRNSMAKYLENLRALSGNENEVLAGHGGLTLESELTRAH